MLMTPNIASHLANSGFFTSKEVEQKVDPQSVAAVHSCASYSLIYFSL